jgi:hypothetical protein
VADFHSCLADTFYTSGRATAHQHDPTRWPQGANVGGVGSRLKFPGTLCRTDSKTSEVVRTQNPSRKSAQLDERHQTILPSHDSARKRPFLGRAAAVIQFDRHNRARGTKWGKLIDRRRFPRASIQNIRKLCHTKNCASATLVGTFFSCCYVAWSWLDATPKITSVKSSFRFPTGSSVGAIRTHPGNSRLLSEAPFRGALLQMAQEGSRCGTLIGDGVPTTHVERLSSPVILTR